VIIRSRQFGQGGFAAGNGVVQLSPFAPRVGPHAPVVDRKWLVAPCVFWAALPG
jgi:hypothetical protein